MLTVRVSRRRWLRGTKENVGKFSSFLLQHKGDGKKMCCLGFAARAGKIPAADIRGVATPRAVHTDKGWPKPLWGLLSSRGYRLPDNSRTCLLLMTTNDTHRLAPREKEARIRNLGRKIGLRFIFVD